MRVLKSGICRKMWFHYRSEIDFIFVENKQKIFIAQNKLTERNKLLWQYFYKSKLYEAYFTHVVTYCYKIICVFTQTRFETNFWKSPQATNKIHFLTIPFASRTYLARRSNKNCSWLVHRWRLRKFEIQLSKSE